VELVTFAQLIGWLAKLWRYRPMRRLYGAGYIGAYPANGSTAQSREAAEAAATVMDSQWSR